MYNINSRINSIIIIIIIITVVVECRAVVTVVLLNFIINSNLKTLLKNI
jgi:predicted CDP-diglyceride synthetase/phosphatidate cytidylyltransferase